MSLTGLSPEVPGEGEGPHDEAVGVHDVLGDGPQVGVAVLHAGDVDAIPDVLHGSDQGAAHQEDEGGDPVVKLGDQTLYLRVGDLDIGTSQFQLKTNNKVSWTANKRKRALLYFHFLESHLMGEIY